ncbi:DUF21 domain-containing protein [Nostocoides sp. HKS02]|uniref:DUF21 domain-containing protein n=1 Tax=Nostocoides sp. HKS02 TaxID=1813880 RepID=UPI00351BD4A5
MTTLVLAALLSIFIAFLLAAAEAAIWRMSRVRAHELLEERRPGAEALARIVADSAAYLSVTAFLRIVAEATTAVLITLGVVDLVDGFWKQVLIAIGVMALVSFVVVGVSPRTLGRQHSDQVALVASPFIVWLRRVLGPLARVLVALGNAVTPRPRLPRRPVPDRVRAARPRRPRRRERGHRGRRARDDPLRLRARRHRGP